MDLTQGLLLAGCWFLIFCGETRSQQEQNVTDLFEEESLLPVKERFRRLIPYMTYYLSQGYNTQNQYVTQTPQQYQAIQPVSNNLRTQPYYVPQYQQQKYQLVPVGYLVGGGYKRTPVYSRPSQTDYFQVSQTPQHPSELTHMITQNYLAIANQVNGQTKDQRPQYTTKLHYANQNQHQSHVYKTPIPVKSHNIYQLPYHSQKDPQRQRYYQTSLRPNHAPLKEDSYVQLHNNYDTNYDMIQSIKNYEPDHNVMTITKSQEIKFQEIEDEVEPTSLPLSTPIETKPQNHHEQSVPTVSTVEQNSLLELLAGYQQTKALPEKVTPSNIGYSIQTLSNILKLLQKAKAQPSGLSSSHQNIDGDSYDSVSQNYSPYQTEGSTPGRAGIDYPALSEIPETRFSCKNQRYKGFFGDPETNCQVWHYCDLNGGQASFLCPNGTIFSQVALTCDWWFNVKCASTAQLYVLNERLYKYILPIKPSFPEDYAGPLVDEYLSIKFQELEAKKKNTTTEKSSSTLQVLLNDEVNQAVK